MQESKVAVKHLHWVTLTCSSKAEGSKKITLNPQCIAAIQDEAAGNDGFNAYVYPLASGIYFNVQETRPEIEALIAEALHGRG